MLLGALHSLQRRIWHCSRLFASASEVIPKFALVLHRAYHSFPNNRFWLSLWGQLCSTKAEFACNYWTQGGDHTKQHAEASGLGWVPTGAAADLLPTQIEKS